MFKDRENIIMTKESDIIRREEKIAIDLEQINISLKRLKELTEKNDDQIAHLELGGKTMGHYIRAVQKEFDARGIKVDFHKLLQEL